jgi:hypothetical protein
MDYIRMKMVHGVEQAEAVLSISTPLIYRQQRYRITDV